MTTIETGVISERSKHYYGWKILIACVIGLALSPGPMVVGSIGVVVAGIMEEHSYSLSQIMMSLAFFTVGAIVGAPIIGKLIDRFGARLILIPSIICLALTLAATPASLSNLKLFYFLMFVCGVTTVGSQSLSYVRVLSTWFDERRGLAIGIAASGIGLGFMFVPLLAQAVLDAVDWAAVYFVLAGIVLAVSVPVVWVTIRNSPVEMPSNRKPENVDTATESPPYQVGMTPKQAIRSKNFWLMTPAIALVAVFMVGLLPHTVPLLKDGGMAAVVAATIASVMGLAQFFGRIIVGFLLDRFFAPFVAIVFFMMGAVGFSILAYFEVGGALTVIAALLIGLGLGAETDLIGYLVSRYFGLRSFSQIYGMVLMGFLFGVGFGPVLLGVSFEYWGSYSPILWIGAAVGILSCFLMALMGPYTKFPEAEAKNT